LKGKCGLGVGWRRRRRRGRWGGLSLSLVGGQHVLVGDPGRWCVAGLAGVVRQAKLLSCFGDDLSGVVKRVAGLLLSVLRWCQWVELDSAVLDGDRDVGWSRVV
jgi:hypothetical protein